MKPLLPLLLFVLAASASLFADGPSDNHPDAVRPIPPLGIEIDSARRSELLEKCQEIRHQLARLSLADPWVCQVEVFPRAVEMTLETDMIYSEKDLQAAARLLQEAERRIEALRSNRQQDVLSNPIQKSLVVGGFRSRIDGSVQPYGLELPADWDGQSLVRLDVWLHGRAERVSEVAFLDQRTTQRGQYAPPQTIVLHPYGRYSNAFKFAGEIDVIEAIEHLKTWFPIDDRRIAIRGFSMGGAGCWQLAVHYPDLWAAANPGAGFSETREFLHSFQQEDFQPTWYQARLLHWYDCPDWTNNLRHVPTIAYSGEIDRQKQAADVMVAAFESRGMKLPHIIGPQTAHKIHPESKIEIQARLDDHLDRGKEELPNTIDFTTYTLRYHRLGWLSIEGLQEHWREARVQGKLLKSSAGEDQIQLTTTNIRHLTLELPAGHYPGGSSVRLLVDDQSLSAKSDTAGSLQVSLVKSDQAGWSVGSGEAHGLMKRPGLQGPIDDAFMNAFAFVGPNSPADPSLVDRWIEKEYTRAKREWQRHFRGDVVEIVADQVSQAELASRNLVLFGTPESNPLVARIAARLPVVWQGERVLVGQHVYEGNHVPVLIYPNPLNPDRYVVLNSGFTFREYAYLNNARQIPMLPDWAIVDITHGSTSQLPGEIKAAGFFDEQWQLPSNALNWDAGNR